MSSIVPRGAVLGAQDGGDVLRADLVEVQVRPPGSSRPGATGSSGSCRTLESGGAARTTFVRSGGAVRAAPGREWRHRQASNPPTQTAPGPTMTPATMTSTCSSSAAAATTGRARRRARGSVATQLGSLLADSSPPRWRQPVPRGPLLSVSANSGPSALVDAPSAEYEYRDCQARAFARDAHSGQFCVRPSSRAGIHPDRPRRQVGKTHTRQLAGQGRCAFSDLLPGRWEWPVGSGALLLPPGSPRSRGALGWGTGRGCLACCAGV
jgi:hypothetical protein